MKERTKWVAAGVLIVSGLGLITRNLLHDPDRGFREEPRQKQLVTVEQVPAPVQETIRKESGGQTVKKLQKERKQGKTKYELEVIRGADKVKIDIAEDGSVMDRAVKRIKPKRASPA
jgi:hypothetical protein